jgi:hypothetical protein
MSLPPESGKKTSATKIAEWILMSVILVPIALILISLIVDVVDDRSQHCDENTKQCPIRRPPGSSSK